MTETAATLPAEPPAEDKPKYSAADDLSAAIAATGWVTRLAVTFLLLIGYVAIIIGSISHEILILPEKSLVLPLFQAPVAVSSFFFYAPILIVALHAYFLLERLRLAIRLREIWPPAVSARALRDGRSSPVFVPQMLFHDPRLGHPADQPWRHRNTLVQYTLKGLLIATTVLPIVVLLMIQAAYLPMHESSITLLHQVLISVDAVLIGLAIILTYRVASAPDERLAGLLDRIILMLLVCAVVFWLAWQTLSLREEPRSPDWFVSYQLDLESWQPHPDTRQRGFLRLSTDYLHHVSLKGAQMGRIDLSNVSLVDADLRGTNLRGARLVNTRLEGADLTGADLTGADLSGASLSGARAIDADFSGARLTGANLEGLSASNATFFAADLRDARLTAADLREADLRLADLSGSWLRATRMAHAKLDGARMITANRLTVGLDLRRASLRGVDKVPSYLVNLYQADLTGSSLADYPRLAVTTGSLQTAISPQLAATLRSELSERIEQLPTKDGSLADLIDRAEQQRDEITPGDTIIEPVADQAPPSDYARKVATELVDAACQKPLLADFLGAKVAGRLLPTEPVVEAAIARRLIASLPDRCPELEERQDLFRAGICERWPGRAAFADACRTDQAR